MKKPYKKPSNTKQLEYKIFKLQSGNTKLPNVWKNNQYFMNILF